MRSAGERVDRIDRHVQREDIEADGDDLLRAALGRVRAAVAAGIEPQDRARRDELDQRVLEIRQCGLTTEPVIADKRSFSSGYTYNP
jgi:hypothetical protein